MINLSFRKKYRSAIIPLAITLGVFSGCTQKINTIDASSPQAQQVLGKLAAATKFAAVIREDELLLISLNGDINTAVLDKGGSFSRPIIAPDKKHTAYLKDTSLYIASEEGVKYKIADGIYQLSFTWQDKDNLIYSPKTGGIYIYNLLGKKSIPYIENEYNYQNIISDEKGALYAEQYLYYEKEGGSYIKDFGVLFYTPETKEERILIKSIPSSLNSGGGLGMYPVIRALSPDNRYLYLWKVPHSGSMASDGVEFAAYDFQNDKLIEYDNKGLWLLKYQDNISLDPKNSSHLAMIIGGGREMGKNKRLAVLNVADGTFEALSPEGEAAMTPSYSEDGKSILYASSREQKAEENIGQWLLNKEHHIYSIHTATKQTKQLTDNPKFFDFAPKYIDDKDIVFFRCDENQNISLWKTENSKEVMLADNLIFYQDIDHSSQHYYDHFNNELFVDIR